MLGIVNTSLPRRPLRGWRPLRLPAAAVLAAALLAGCVAPVAPAAPAAPATAPAQADTPAAEQPESAGEVGGDVFCTATAPDMLGPFYEPGAPERSSVGEGYTLVGVVRSTDQCTPIAGAQIEAWMAGPDGVYSDAYRATFFSDAEGKFTFTSPVPVPYAGRPPHIHLKVTAPGFAELVTQHYPAAGETRASTEIVLEPQSS